MSVDIRACLYDVQQAILEIESFFEGQPMLFAAYQADTRTRRATERNLKIIGEAVGRILKKPTPRFSSPTPARLSPPATASFTATTRFPMRWSGASWCATCRC